MDRRRTGAPGVRWTTRQLGRVAWAGVALLGTSSLLALTAVGASASKPKTAPKHATAKTPCLVGNWKVTDFILNSTGSSASGGAGTLIDISANRKVVGMFTPGAILKAPNGGTFKFNGTDYGSYGFNTKSTAKSGAFIVTYTAASNATISVNGSAPEPTGKGATTGSFVCKGKGVTLSFPAGGDTIQYVLAPAK